MLLSELKELLKNYREEELRLLISEMYKAMPKKLRVDKGIDAMLQDIRVYRRIGKIAKPPDKHFDIIGLKQETNQFIGKWDIVAMEIWDEEYFNMEVQA